MKLYDHIFGVGSVMLCSLALVNCILGDGPWSQQLVDDIIAVAQDALQDLDCVLTNHRGRSRLVKLKTVESDTRTCEKQTAELVKWFSDNIFCSWLEYVYVFLFALWLTGVPSGRKCPTLCTVLLGLAPPKINQNPDQDKAVNEDEWMN